MMAGTARIAASVAVFATALAAETLETALDDARPYSAERHAMRLIATNTAPAAPFLYTAANVAGAIGKPDVRRDRLLYVVRTEQGATPEARAALVALCLDGADADFFARYVRQFGADGDTFEIGLRQLRRLCALGKSSEYVKLLTLMFDTWKTPDANTTLRREMIAARRANVYGLDATALAETAAAHRFYDTDLLDAWNAWNDGGWGKAAPAGAYLLRVQEAQPDALLPVHLYHAILNFRDYPEAERSAFAQRVWAFLPLMEKADDTRYLRLLLGTLGMNHDVFFGGDKPVASPEDVVRIVRRNCERNPADYGLALDIRRVWARLGLDEDAQRRLADEFPRYMFHDTVRDLYDKQFAGREDAAALRDCIKKFGASPSLKWTLFDAILRVGDKALVTDALTDFVTENPTEFNPLRLNQVLSADVFPLPERVEMLKNLFARTGWSPAWQRLAEQENLPHKNTPEVQAFVNTIQPGAKGTDAFLVALIEFMALTRGADNSPPQGLTDAARKVADAYAGDYPQPGSPARNNAFDRFYRNYYNFVRDNKTLSREWCDIMIPKLGKGANWGEAGNVAAWSGERTALRALAARCLAVEGTNALTFGGVWEEKDSRVAVYGNVYGTINARTAADYVVRNLDMWPHDFGAAELARFLEQVDFSALTLDGGQRLLDAVWHVARRDAAQAAAMPFDKLAAWLLDAWQGDDIMRERFLHASKATGRLDVMLPRYLAGAKKLSPARRVRALALLLEWSDGRSDAPLLAATEPLGDFTAPYGLVPLFHTAYANALRQLASPQLACVPSRALRHFDTLRARVGDDAARVESLDNAARLAMTTISQEASVLGSIHMLGAISVRVLEADLAAGDRRGVIARCRAALLCYDRNRADVFLNALAKLAEAGMWEAVYMLADGIDRADANARPEFAKWRAEATTHTAGTYPVSENDRAYPLYVAADELMQNRNPERAWFLLSRNLGEFEKDPLRFPPPFVAWSVEQLRTARGDRDALLAKAGALADAMLLKENRIPAELAASLMLTKAEIARELRRFDAAHLDYTAIRNHPVYSKTPSGRKAMFRDADLMVAMGNAVGAEQTAELWLASEDAELRAQAHYLFARIAFERKDYEETRRRLDEVFALDFTHTEARLLFGHWKLATNYEVDDTQVLAGTLSDRTLIRPGQPLTITVHDPNFGVAGGGASIPVRIETSVGRDAETVLLNPSPRNPSRFRGVIDTALGAAVPGNLVLDVRGGETVSYRIAPEFIAVRGLDATPPKVLRVADDAAMLVGATRPAAADGVAEDELTTLLEDGSAESRALSSNLRPGSPLYIAVRDFDKSVTDAPDSVFVAIRTAAGDTLPRVELKETGAFTGIFRAAVPTFLPPPLATASDTAAGVNPCDVINSRRAGTWQSLPDGKKNKWIEVDTMGSHSVAVATADMPNPGAVAMLRLYGRLGFDERLLAVFGSDADARGGVSVRHDFTGMRGSTNLRRHFRAGAQEAVVQDDWTVAFQGTGHREQRVLASGFLCPEDAQRVRLRFVPDAPEGRDAHMHETWVEVYLDGQRIFSGNGATLAEQGVDAVLTPEPRLLEIFAGARRNNDSFRLMIETDDGTLAHIPAHWSAPDGNPKLAEFLSEKATLARTATGFKAVFAKPERLRALKWEFVDFAGDGVEVSALGIVDADGSTIVPAETDYSESLGNDTLDVVPGDRVFVTYIDEVASNGERRIIERNLTSSFHDAEIDFFFEHFETDKAGHIHTLRNPAYRIHPGDSVLVCVSDPDMDVSPGSDSVALRVRSDAGNEVALTAVEERDPRAREGFETYVGGKFYALLNTVDASDAAAVAASPKALPVMPGGMVTAIYFDRENTHPGIAVERENRIPASGNSAPEVRLFHTRVERVEDTRTAAAARLRQIRKRAGNEHASAILRDVVHADAMRAEELRADVVTVNAAAPVPIVVRDASRARHADSRIEVSAVTRSELAAAAAEGREPKDARMVMRLGAPPDGIRFKPGSVYADKNTNTDLFHGLLRLGFGNTDYEAPEPTRRDDRDVPPPVLQVAGNDIVLLRVLGEDGKTQLEKRIAFAADARLSLMDGTYTAERTVIHLGDRFNLLLEDADADTSDAQDSVEVEAEALGSGAKHTIRLTETLPHSGVFTGSVRPAYFGDNAAPEAAADVLPVAYGDTVVFRYTDTRTLAGDAPRVVAAEGTVSKGADGSVSLYSKRFRSAEQAVQVQFRMAETLFETAKEQRKLGRIAESAAAVAEGRAILEAALRENPGTGYAEQGRYLLGNLYQELAAERKEAGDMEAARPFYQDAISHFAEILSTWPEGDYAPRAQYHKALCLEMLGDAMRAGEEYVKMMYLYPDSPLVGDAAIRLATYYYAQEKKYDTAGRIYLNFHARFPTHERAAAALFMGAQCHIKQAETLWGEDFGKGGPPPLVVDKYRIAIEAFDTLTQTHTGTSEQEQKLRAQAMYWAGDASCHIGDNKNAYLYFKRVIFEYPETEWARRARGRLLQDEERFRNLQ